MARVIYTNEAFPITPNPPSGSFYLGVDPVDGHLKLQNSSGAVFDYNSGALYSDAEAVDAIEAFFDAAPIKTQLQDSDRIMIRDQGGSYRTATRGAVLGRNVDRFHNVFSDFLGTVAGDFLVTSSGAGASAQSGSYGADTNERAIGVTQIDTGTTSTGRCGIGLAAPSTIRLSLARYRWESRMAIESLSTISETFVVRAGIYDGYNVAGEGTNGLYFRYTDLQNGGRWEAVSRAASGDLAVVDTGVAPDLDYHTYAVEANEAGTQVTFLIDGALVATINTPLLPSSAQALNAGVKIEKSAGTGQRNLSLDWMYFELDRSSAR